MSFSAVEHPDLSPILQSIEAGTDNNYIEGVIEFLILVVENGLDTVRAFTNGMNAVEKAKAEHVIEQVEKYLEQLAKQKKLGFLGGLLKVLGVLATILAALGAMLCPSPATIAILVVSVAMFLEPLLAGVAGYDSIVEQSMSKLFELLNNIMGPIGSAIAGSLILIAVMLGSVALAAKGLSCMGGMFNGLGQSSRAFMTGLVDALNKVIQSAGTNLPQAVKKALLSLVELIKDILNGTAGAFQQGMLRLKDTVGQSTGLLAKLINPNMSQQSQNMVYRVIETIEACLTLGISGIQIDMGVLKYEVAQLLHEYEIDQAWIDKLTALAEDLSHNAVDFQAALDRFLKITTGILGPRLDI